MAVGMLLAVLLLFLPAAAQASTPTSIPTVEMYDTIDVSTVPQGAKVVAGYTAGFWPTYLGLVKAFPHAIHISIAISVRWHADCLDVEPGDATPAEAGAWVVADIKAGFARPCLYANLSQMPAVKLSLAAALGPNWRAKVFLWLAWYRFIPGLVSGYDAVQWTDRALGRNLDESTVTLAFLTIGDGHVLPPAPPVRPHCFGPHAQLKLAQCKTARENVASWSRERDALLRQVEADVSVTLVSGHFVVAVSPFGKQLEQVVLALQKSIDATVY